MSLPRKNLKKVFLASMVRFDEPQAEIVKKYAYENDGELAAVLRELALFAIEVKESVKHKKTEFRRRYTDFSSVDQLRRQSDLVH